MFGRHTPLRMLHRCASLSFLLSLLLSPAIPHADAQATQPVTAAPVISPAAGQYGSAQTITITDSTPGATIYYQITTESGLYTYDTSPVMQYTAPFVLTSSDGAGVTAYATAPGHTQSPSTLINYEFALRLTAAPGISPAGGVYNGPQVITISDDTPGTTIYYTLDGTSAFLNPDRLTYTGPITIKGNAVVTAFAASDKNTTGPPSSAQYILTTANDPFIYTIAGSEHTGYSGDGGPATQADLNGVTSVAKDAAGNIYIADASNFRVRKIAAGTGIITTYAGTGVYGYSGDGGQANQAMIGYVSSIVVNDAGDLYLADQSNNVIRKISASTSTISTIAGNGKSEYIYQGDGGPATAASFYSVTALAVSPAGDLYVDDLACAIRKIATSTGIITTVVGIPEQDSIVSGCGFSGDGGPAGQATIGHSYGLAFDTTGNLFISSIGPNLMGLIRRVDASTNFISTVAGLPPGATPSPAGSGLALGTVLNSPSGVAVDSHGNLFFAETGTNTIRRVDAKTGMLSKVTSGLAGSTGTFGGDGGPAIDAGIDVPQQVIIDSSDNLLTIDGEERVREIIAAAAQPASPAPSPVFSLSPGTYNKPQMLTISDEAPGATIYVTLDGSKALPLSLAYNGPIAITGNVTVTAVAAAPGFVVSDTTQASYKITSPPTAIINTVAGTSKYGVTGSNVPATSTYLNTIQTVATDTSGNVYFYSTIFNQIFKVTPDGTLQIVAGNRGFGRPETGVPAVQTSLLNVKSLALDRAGNLYVLDQTGQIIRKVDAATGIITTIAGTYPNEGPPLPNGDGGPASAATLNSGVGLAFDPSGDLLIAEAGGCRIRRIDAATGNIQTVFGTGTCGHTGDGGAAANAELLSPTKIACAANGDVYVLEDAIYIRKISAATGVITTIAGKQSGGSNGDGGPALDAQLNATDLAVDANNNVYFTDTPSNTVRKIDATTGIITSIAGNGYYGFSGDGGAATMASLFSPNGLAFDPSGNLYIADSLNSRIRKISAPLPASAPTFSLAAGTYNGPQTITVSDTTTDAVIYYTTDGSVPTADSSTYTGPLTFSAPTTLKAIAFAPGYQGSAVTSASYSIVVSLTPTLTVSPAAVTVSTTQSLALVVAVSGPTGAAVPTGSITLAVGSKTQQAALAQGTATFQLDPSLFQPGTNVVTATYSGDTAYTAAKGSSVVNVAQVTADVSQPATPVVAGSTSVTKINVVAGSAYSGTLSLSCALTASPANAQHLPACNLAPGTVTVSAGATATVTASVTTTAASATQARNTPPLRPGWPGMVTCASLLLFLAPGRRRSLRVMLLLCLGMVSATLMGCTGGTVGTTQPVTPANGGTTSGSYTFTVTAADTANSSLGATTTFTVQVQ